MNGDTGTSEPTSDNRLTLDPSDNRWASDIEGLNEGDSVTLTINATVIAPGDFSVTSASFTAAPEAGAGAAASESMLAETGQAEKGLAQNPAITAMLGEGA